MMDKILSKKSIVSFGIIIFFSYAVLMLIAYFVNVSWLFTVNYILIGVISTAGIIYLAKEKAPIRFRLVYILLAAFLIWYILSCLSMTITYGSDWVDYNSDKLLITASCGFVFFPLGGMIVREKTKIPIGAILLHVLLLGWTVFILYVVINMFQGNALHTPNDGWIFMDGANSLCLNCNRNTTGSWQMLFFLACCFMILRNRKIWVKGIYFIAGIINYVALILSSSRTCIMCALVGFALIAGIGAYIRLEKKKTVYRILISSAVGIAAGIVFYFCRGFILNSFIATTHSELTGREALVFESRLAGRTDIWKWTLEGIVTSIRMFLFGVTPESVPEMLSQISGGAITGMYTHNQFLEIAAGIGVPGLCIFLVWLGVIIKDTYKLYFKEKSPSAFWCIPVIVAALIAANMMEAYIVFYNHISCFTFFLLCGMIHGKANEIAIEKVPKSNLSRQELRRKERQAQKKKVRK